MLVVSLARRVMQMMDDEMRTIKRPALGRSWLERN
jgi:hypothetical protein